MITPQDILNLKLDKITDEELRKEIEGWIKDYKDSNGDENFIKDSQQIINDYYSLVSDYFPSALGKKDSKSSPEPEQKPSKPSDNPKSGKSKDQAPKPPKKDGKGEGKLAKVLIAVIGDFDGILEELKQSDIDEADYIFFLEMTEKLQEALESGDEEKIMEALEEALQPFEEWLANIVEESEEAAKEATESVNKLLKEMGMDVIEEPSQMTLRELLDKTIIDFKQWTNYLDGKDKETIQDVMLDLSLAADKSDEAEFKESVEEAITNHLEEIDIANEKIQKQANNRLKRLEKALRENRKTGKSKKKESTAKKPTSKPKPSKEEQLQQQVDELMDELEECREGCNENTEEQKDTSTPSSSKETDTPDQKENGSTPNMPQSSDKKSETEKDTEKKAEDKKPTPKKTPDPTDKIIHHLLGLIKNIPDALKEDTDTQLQTKASMMELYKTMLVEAWKLNDKKAENIKNTLNEAFDKMVSQVRINKKIYDTIIMEEHDSAYALVEGELWVAPLYKNGTINTDKFGVVQKSPNHFKKEIDRILENLGMKSPQKREALLANLQFWSTKSDN